MIVIILTNCPSFLRGDLTKWFYEIGTNVFAGTVSARVRDNLWERIVRSCTNGKVTMIYSVRNEQRFEFRVHNSDWEPVDYEGLKLMMKPLPSDKIVESAYRSGYSKASGYRSAKRYSGINKGSESSYAVMHLTTTGPKPQSDHISAIDIICVRENAVYERFSRTISTDSHEDDRSSKPYVVLSEALSLMEGADVITIQASDVMRFIEATCERYDIIPVDFNIKDLQTMSKKILMNIRDHSFEGLKEYYKLNSDEKTANGMQLCDMIFEIYKRLMNQE